MHNEDANYFEPTENDLGDDIVSQYEKNLNKIFSFDNITENQIYFLVRPSFEPEHLLILEKLQDKFVLTLITLTKNYWAVFYEDNKIIDIDKKVLTSELNKIFGDKLLKLLDKAITEARQPKANGFTLDGVEYRLLKLSNLEQKTVSKHSPSETFRSAKIIAILEQLIEKIETLDDATLLNIETKIRDLQD